MVKRSAAFIARPSKEYGLLMLKRPELPGGFDGVFLKTLSHVSERVVEFLINLWAF